MKTHSQWGQGRLLCLPGRTQERCSAWAQGRVQPKSDGVTVWALPPAGQEGISLPGQGQG